MASGCANMNTGGYLGMVGGAAAGGYAGSEMDDGSGTMTVVGAVIGGSLGMVLGSGAVSPGEMAQAAVEADVVGTIAQASATPAPVNTYGTASNSAPGTGTSVGVATPNNAPAGEEQLADKAVSVYFILGMVPTEKNTRNPMCYSNTFSVTIPFNPRGWGNNGRLLEVIQPMMETFRSKCAQLGSVVPGPVNYGASDNIASGFPRSAPHAEDYTVVMP
ncbi:hypothetical protein IC614_04375 [Allosphingosinicella flava]|uniref:Uncharacterized protein n=1 Tax=Allosphingosinicella flava TaxID=2771430 RepID=A0A7T2GL25_9SPHN|nr:hypothetical protein [Sphingosinicella flava]QPQ55829.1 hypothetical protein IC614_04375 [Sphingosinicella flava]